MMMEGSIGGGSGDGCWIGIHTSASHHTRLAEYLVTDLFHPHAKIVQPSPYPSSLSTAKTLSAASDKATPESVAASRSAHGGTPKLVHNEMVLLWVPDIQSVLDTLRAHSFLNRYIHRYLIFKHNIPYTAASSDPIYLPPLDIDKEKNVYKLLVYPSCYTSQVIAALPLDIPLHPTNYTHVISLLYYTPSPETFLPSAIPVSSVSSAPSPQCLYYGIEEASAYYDVKEATTISRSLSACPEAKSSASSSSAERISRASYKIQEALERCSADVKLKSNWRALDVGAAPGGWTQYLSYAVHEVVAIDPAELRLSPMPTNVTHYRMKGQDYLDLITRQQAEDGASKTIDQVRGGPFDVIACDMNLDPVEMLEIMAPLFSLAADGGYLILTLKYPKRGEAQLDAFAQEFVKTEFSSEKHGSVWEVLHVVWLFANTFERTVIARKRLAGLN